MNSISQQNSQQTCCLCSSSKIRCRTDTCPCYKQGKLCQANCQSARWTNDCLNKPVVRCDCARLAYGAATSASGRGRPEILFCQLDENCACFRYGEACTEECQCRLRCNFQKGGAFALDYAQFPKPERPTCQCTCSARSQCRKVKKCACLQKLSYCGTSCKCKRECANTRAHFHLSKATKHFFFDPEQYASGEALVAHIISAKFNFKLEIVSPDTAAVHAEELLRRIITRALSAYNLPLQHLVVYTPNSPCFHQDCQPRCDVVDECKNGKACAQVLTILYQQIRKLARNAHIEMTVRILNPYVARGDLYTKHAILALMESGIKVEPLTVKDWAELMKEGDYTNEKRHSKKSQSAENLSHRQPEKSPAARNPYYDLWHAADMDKYVRLSQHYINECRRAMDFPECFWTSPFHDLLKMTVLTCADAATKLNQICVHLKRNQSNISRNNRYENYTSSSDQNQTDEQNGNRTYRARCHSSGPTTTDLKNSKWQIVDEIVDALSKSVAEMENEEKTSRDDENLPRASATNSLILQQQNVQENQSINDHVFPAASSTPMAAEKIIFNLSGRNMIEGEQREIKTRLMPAVENIQQQLTALMQYLDQKIASVPV